MSGKRFRLPPRFLDWPGYVVKEDNTAEGHPMGRGMPSKRLSSDHRIIGQST